MDLYGWFVATERAGGLKSHHSPRWSPHVLLLSQGTMEKTLAKAGQPTQADPWCQPSHADVLDQPSHLKLVLAQGLPAALKAFLEDEVGDKGLGSDGHA